MKNFPRIYSLSTLGLIHHQEFDYLFHPSRTDFIGESGSGKSMIADLIQLILVGSDAFESATKATGKRDPEGMVLTEGGHGKSIGYAFLNIEMQPNKYLVAGAYIETGIKNVQAFVIQQSFQKDEIVYLEMPITFKEFMQNDDILPLDKLKDTFSEKGMFCQSWTKLKKYHEILYDHNIVPINLAENHRSLRSYAEILQSFSRGKLLDTQKSSSLKTFLFGKETANKIFEQYKAGVKDMEATIGEYGSNLTEIARVSEKQSALLELKKDREERDRFKKDWLEKRLLYSNQQAAASKKEIVDIVSGFVSAQQHLDILKELLASEINNIETLKNNLKIDHQARTNRFFEYTTNYKEVEKVSKWLSDSNSSIEKLKDIFTKNNKIRAQKKYLADLMELLRSKHVEDIFATISAKDTPASLHEFLTSGIIDLKKQIEIKESLKRFSNITDPDSLAYWAIQQKRAFSLEEESVILELQKLPRKRPIIKRDYLPFPDELMKHLLIAEKQEDGFWLNLTGVRTFIPYAPKQLLNTTNIKEITTYFSSYSESLDKEILQLKKSQHGYESIQTIFTGLTNQNETLAAYNTKGILETYKLIPSLNISEDEFDKAMGLYKNKIEIEELYFETEHYLEDISEKIRENENLLTVYRIHEGFRVDANNEIIEELKEDNEYRDLIENLSKNIQHTKSNVQSVLTRSSDKAASIKRYQDDIRPKLQKISELRDRIEEFKKLNTELESAKKTYLGSYPPETMILISPTHVSAPDAEYTKYMVAETGYARKYKETILKYISSEAYKLEGEDNLSELAKNLLPEAFHDTVLADQAEITIIETIANYLRRINEKNRQLNTRKIQKIKDLLHEVDVAISEQENTIRRIDNFLKNETNITGGYKARLKKTTSPSFPKDWMTRFQENLEDTLNNFESQLAEKVDLENMIITAYLNCGGYSSAQPTVQLLLDPAVYYDVTFNMESETGRVNKGSTGQTYAAIALLCIARLSLMDKEEGKKQQPAVRVMPIDEAEGLGSNYDMLRDIARNYDYQIISLSIGPVGKFMDGEQYLYMLHKNMEVEERINYTPYAILSEIDKSKLSANT